MGSKVYHSCGMYISPDIIQFNPIYFTSFSSIANTSWKPITLHKKVMDYY